MYEFSILHKEDHLCFASFQNLLCITKYLIKIINNDMLPIIILG